MVVGGGVRFVGRGWMKESVCWMGGLGVGVNKAGIW